MRFAFCASHPGFDLCVLSTLWQSPPPAAAAVSDPQHLDHRPCASVGQVRGRGAHADRDHRRQPGAHTRQPASGAGSRACAPRPAATRGMAPRARRPPVVPRAGRPRHSPATRVAPGRRYVAGPASPAARLFDHSCPLQARPARTPGWRSPLPAAWLAAPRLLPPGRGLTHSSTHVPGPWGAGLLGRAVLRRDDARRHAAGGCALSGAHLAALAPSLTAVSFSRDLQRFASPFGSAAGVSC